MGSSETADHLQDDSPTTSTSILSPRSEHDAAKGDLGGEDQYEHQDKKQVEKLGEELSFGVELEGLVCYLTPDEPVPDDGDGPEGQPLPPLRFKYKKFEALKTANLILQHVEMTLQKHGVNVEIRDLNAQGLRQLEEHESRVEDDNCDRFHVANPSSKIPNKESWVVEQDFSVKEFHLDSPVTYEDELPDSPWTTHYRWQNFEIHSPAFAPKDALEVEGAKAEVQYVIRLLSTHYRIRTNPSCGLHVHVGNGISSHGGLGDFKGDADAWFPGRTIQQLGMLLWAADPLLSRLHEPWRRVHDYSTSIRYKSKLACFGAPEAWGEYKGKGHLKDGRKLSELAATCTENGQPIHFDPLWFADGVDGERSSEVPSDDGDGNEASSASSHNFRMPLVSGSPRITSNTGSERIPAWDASAMSEKYRHYLKVHTDLQEEAWERISWLPGWGRPDPSMEPHPFGVHCETDGYDATAAHTAAATAAGPDAVAAASVLASGCHHHPHVSTQDGLKRLQNTRNAAEVAVLLMAPGHSRLNYNFKSYGPLSLAAGYERESDERSSDGGVFGRSSSCTDTETYTGTDNHQDGFNNDSSACYDDGHRTTADDGQAVGESESDDAPNRHHQSPHANNSPGLSTSSNASNSSSVPLWIGCERSDLRTIEFREAGGSFDLEWVTTWVGICTGLVKFAAAAAADNRNKNNGKYDMSKILSRVMEEERRVYSQATITQEEKEKDGGVLSSSYDVGDLLKDIGLSREAAWVRENRRRTNKAPDSAYEERRQQTRTTTRAFSGDEEAFDPSSELSHYSPSVFVSGDEWEQRLDVNGLGIIINSNGKYPSSPSSSSSSLEDRHRTDTNQSRLLLPSSSLPDNNNNNNNEEAESNNSDESTRIYEVHSIGSPDLLVEQPEEKTSDPEPEPEPEPESLSVELRRAVGQYDLTMEQGGSVPVERIVKKERRQARPISPETPNNQSMSLDEELSRLWNEYDSEEVENEGSSNVSDGRSEGRQQQQQQQNKQRNPSLSKSHTSLSLFLPDEERGGLRTAVSIPSPGSTDTAIFVSSDPSRSLVQKEGEQAKATLTTSSKVENGLMGNNKEAKGKEHQEGVEEGKGKGKREISLPGSSSQPNRQQTTRHIIINQTPSSSSRSSSSPLLSPLPPPPDVLVPLCYSPATLGLDTPSQSSGPRRITTSASSSTTSSTSSSRQHSSSNRRYRLQPPRGARARHSIMEVVVEEEEERESQKPPPPKETKSQPPQVQAGEVPPKPEKEDEETQKRKKKEKEKKKKKKSQAHQQEQQPPRRDEKTTTSRKSKSSRSQQQQQQKTKKKFKLTSRPAFLQQQLEVQELETLITESLEREEEVRRFTERIRDAKRRRKEEVGGGGQGGGDWWWWWLFWYIGMFSSGVVLGIVIVMSLLFWGLVST